MKKSNEYLEYIVCDVLCDVRDINTRPIMSGWCIYHLGIPIGAIISNEFYIKTRDQVTIDELKKLGSKQFEYEKSNGKTVGMCYWSVPEDLLENKIAFSGMLEKIIN